MHPFEQAIRFLLEEREAHGDVHSSRRASQLLATIEASIEKPAPPSAPVPPSPLAVTGPATPSILAAPAAKITQKA